MTEQSTYSLQLPGDDHQDRASEQEDWTALMQRLFLPEAADCALHDIPVDVVSAAQESSEHIRFLRWLVSADIADSMLDAIVQFDRHF